MYKEKTEKCKEVVSKKVVKLKKYKMNEKIYNCS